MAIFTAIGAAFTAISGFIGSLGAIGAFALQTAAGIGLNLLAQAIAGKPQDPKFSVNGTLQSGGDLPRTILFGYTATAGSLVYANTWGNVDETDNAYLTQVIALSDFPVRELREVWVNGELCTLGAVEHAERGYPVNEYRKDGYDNLWVKLYDGTQTAADPFLVSKVSSAARPYNSTRVGAGVAYAITTAKVTKNLFSGIPSFKFALYGARLYDITKDSTQGGSGTHRDNDPSTWGGDGDFLPAVQIYNVLRGINYGGKWLYGVQGMSGVRLPAAHWRGQINKCRAVIASADGPVPTYRSGGEVAVDAPIGDAIEAFLTTCQGRLSEAGGVYKLYCGAPGSPVASFTDGEILSSEEQSFTPFFGLADTINGISARYPSPAEGWNQKVAPPLYRPDLEVLAGNRRLMADVPLDFVPYAEQVQRLMKSALEEAQRARRHTFVLPPQYWVLEPGDIVSWTSERNGYITKLFRVDGVVDRANLDVMVDLTEVDPADYDWNSETDFHPPVDGAVGPVRPSPQPIIDWFAEPWQIEDALGRARRPAIRLAWNGDQPDVDAVVFEVALAETLEVIHRGRTDEVEVGSLVTSQGLLPNEDYYVIGRYDSASQREMVWSAPLLVRTLDIRMGDDDVYLPGLIEEVAESVKEGLDFVGPEQIRTLRENMRRLALYGIEQDGANVLDKQEWRQAVTATALDTTAKYELLVQTRVQEINGIISTVSGRVETLEAITVPALISAQDAVSVRVDQAENAIVAAGARVATLEGAMTGYTGANALASAFNGQSIQISNLAGDLTSVATGLSLVETSVGRFSASGLFRTSVMSTESGAQSTIGIAAAASSGGAPTTAALLLNARAGGIGEVGIIADRFYMRDAAGRFDPFIIDSGTAYFNNARIRNLTATNINVANLTAQTGFFDNLTLVDGNIPARIITAEASFSGSLPSSLTWASGTVATPPSSGFAAREWIIGQEVINSNSGLPIFYNLAGSFSRSYTFTGSGSVTLIGRLIMRVMSGSTMLREFIVAADSFTRTGTGSVAVAGSDSALLYAAVPSAGNYTLRAVLYLAHNPTLGGSGPDTTGNTSAEGVATCNRF
ncbi:phage tail protein [Mesorhizobium sp. CAU 1732]|uniref:phage tail protein n=1 Tax=Mesorhizobium sp. CAU 1732 TaxID=3140358 RepID=UPI00325FF3B9